MKDQSMRLILFCGLIVAVLPGSAFAQEVASAQQRRALADLWLVRSHETSQTSAWNFTAGLLLRCFVRFRGMQRDS